LPPGQSRPDFQDELALTRAWLPRTEAALHANLDEMERWAASLPRIGDVYGLVHNDLCEDNLLWAAGEPTVIDFDDCCFTWFAADIARSLGSLHEADGGRFRQVARWCLGGYRDVRSLDGVTEAWLPRFVKLNAIANLAWCLYARWRGLDIEDASEETEAHLRVVIGKPEDWLW
jgi:Ser/Thr protein kinase RdoA (MazF antagonist)